MGDRCGRERERKKQMVRLVIDWGKHLDEWMDSRERSKERWIARFIDEREIEE